MSECIPVAKVCNNCACYEVCIYANPGRKKDCSLWKPDMSWIPVSEMHPEQYRTVLVWTRFKEMGEAMFVGEHFVWMDDDGVNDYAQATHWMPFPEPPKGDSNV